MRGAKETVEVGIDKTPEGHCCGDNIVVVKDGELNANAKLPNKKYPATNINHGNKKKNDKVLTYIS